MRVTKHRFSDVAGEWTGGQHGLRLSRAAIHVLHGCGASQPTLSIRQAAPRPTEDPQAPDPSFSIGARARNGVARTELLGAASWRLGRPCLRSFWVAFPGLFWAAFGANFSQPFPEDFKQGLGAIFYEVLKPASGSRLCLF